MTNFKAALLRRQWPNALLAALALGVLAVISDVLTLLSRYVSAAIDGDTRIMYEAGSTVTTVGVPRLEAFVNSPQGSDILFWTHQLSSYVYGLFISWLELDIYSFNLLVVAQYLLVVAATIGAMWYLTAWLKLSRWWTLLLIPGVMYAPLFNILFLAQKMYLAPSYLLGLAGLILLLHYYDTKQAFWPAVLSGLVAAMALHSFVSIGLPIMAGVLISWVGVLWWQRRAGLPVVHLIGALLVGWLLPQLLLAGYALITVPIASLRALWIAGFSYVDLIVAGGAQQPYVLELGYALASMIVPPQGFSLLPIGLALLVAAWLIRAELDQRVRYFVGVVGLATLSGLALMVLIPSHVTSQSLVWLLPMQLMLLPVIITNGKKQLAWLAGITVAVVAGQSVYRWWLDSYGVIMIAVAAALSLLIGLLLTSFIIKYGWLNKLMLAAGTLAIVLVFGISLQAHLLGLRSNATNLIHYYLSGREWPAQHFSEVAAELIRQRVRPGQQVLTNEPISDFFPAGTNLQALYHYRGLMGGARRRPADVAIVFGQQGAIRNGDYQNLAVGVQFYFRGFVYEINERLELPAQRMLFIAEPVETPGTTVEYPRRYVPAAEVEQYLDWREQLGLPS